MMTTHKHIKLGLFLAGYGHHVASWRHENAIEKGPMDLTHLINTAQLAEKGLFDLVFLADSLFVSESSHPNILSRFEPFTLLSVLSTATTNIGLAATASTTYSEPFHIARQFSSLDHLSHGRAAWNIVTSSITSTAENFNGTKLMEHELRYERANEFVEVTNKLWRSWDKGALVRDKETGTFIDASKLHTIDHEGKHFKVRGPLNIERSPQGRPLLIQAGSSPTGTDLASKVADVIFTAQTQIEDAQNFYKQLKEKVSKQNRNPEEVYIMPGLFPILGDTEEEAHQNYQEIQDLILPEVGLSILAPYVGNIDLSQYDLDTKFADLDLSTGNGVQSRFEIILKEAIKNDLTLEEVYKKVAGSRGHHIFVGTPEQLADKMEEWFKSSAADGFNIMPPILPSQFELFINNVIPILQERNLYKETYSEGTLRQKLGLENE
ncbi:LLM class flavin-dependent oxidoreductase [Mammaliicoccus sp. FSL K6-3158]|uniref:LLM class flavin-dependent oxidoreductase n=1 Tax=Mammaliicoccus TaxID=2803850 RepID=UPI002DC02B29|nr:LLM class flavin-dependent oxidoreductase [Mammaliicoccus sciuri]MEB7768152.1 LLM class flavin-dependent oxidoreductase [Mammaliicoccus sciuri]MEB7819191.1 LLM class flavin-dependent oxidoreductase [Mammaliicoccus sciuri]